MAAAKRISAAALTVTRPFPGRLLDVLHLETDRARRAGDAAGVGARRLARRSLERGRRRELAADLVRRRPEARVLHRLRRRELALLDRRERTRAAGDLDA